MWGSAAIFFFIAAIAVWIATEVLREVVDRKRVRERGVGGTQDIALWGTAVLILCVVAAVVAFIGWFLEENKPFDIPVAIQRCSGSCQQDLKGQTTNSASLAFKMTALDVEDLCTCSCEGAFRRMTPGQFARLEKMTSTESVRADQGIRGLFDEAFKACYPTFAK